MERFPCPCCGYLVFSGPPGTDEICPICGWEDDVSQLRFLRMAGGANKPSLVDAQKNFMEAGASDIALIGRLRAPAPFEHKDPEWRPIGAAENICDETRETGPAYPLDRTELYYWRDSDWRRKK